MDLSLDPRACPDLAPTVTSARVRFLPVTPASASRTARHRRPRGRVRLGGASPSRSQSGSPMSTLRRSRRRSKVASSTRRLHATSMVCTSWARSIRTKSTRGRSRPCQRWTPVSAYGSTPQSPCDSCGLLLRVLLSHSSARADLPPAVLARHTRLIDAFGAYQIRCEPSLLWLKGLVSRRRKNKDTKEIYTCAPPCKQTLGCDRASSSGSSRPPPPTPESPILPPLAPLFRSRLHRPISGSLRGKS